MPLIALGIAIAKAIGFVGTAATVAGYAIGTAIAIGISYAINAALAPSIKDPKRATGQYQHGPQTSEEAGLVVPVAYGTQILQPNIVGHYTYARSNDDFRFTTETQAFSVYQYRMVRSTMHRRILCCFGRGPFEEDGIDLDTVRINGTLLSSIPNASAEWVRGLVDQDVLTGWDVGRQDYHVGTHLEKDVPVTWEARRTGADEAVVAIHCPALVGYHKDGGTTGAIVALKIEAGDAVAGTWQTVTEGKIVGEGATPLTFRVDLADPPAVGFSKSEFGAWYDVTTCAAFTVTRDMRLRVRVTRTNAESTSSRVSDKAEFGAVRLGRDVAYTHPGMVLLSLNDIPPSVTQGGIHEISVQATGKIVDDGSGTFGVSRYHADAIRDILTQPVIEGDGDATPYEANYYQGVDPSRLTGAGWASQRALSDAEVPDGQGGAEALLRCDAVFANATTVHGAVGLIGVSGRCGLLYHGRKFGLWVDSPREPAFVLCDGNWLADGDNRPNLVPVAGDELASQTIARFRDESAGYDQRTVALIDHDSELTGQMNLDLAAATRTSEVARLARREMARNRLVDATISVPVDLDAIIYEPGDVGYVQIDGRSIGGRVTAVDGRTITLSMAIDEVVTGSDMVVVQVHDGGTRTVEVHPVASVSGSLQLTIGEDWTVTPAVGDPFLFGPVAIADDVFEVVDAQWTEQLYGQLALARYVPGLDDLDDLPPDATIPASQLTRVDQFGGVRRTEIPSETLEAIGQRSLTSVEIGNYTFADEGGGAVSWVSLLDTEGDALGYVRYGTDVYQPADDEVGTTNRYIYWDPDDPDVFQTSDDLDDVYGLYLACINDGGTPLPQHGRLAGSESFTVGLSGTYTLAEVASITIVNGQITAVLPRVRSGSAADTATATDAAAGSIS